MNKDYIKFPGTVPQGLLDELVVVANTYRTKNTMRQDIHNVHTGTFAVIARFKTASDKVYNDPVIHTKLSSVLTQVASTVATYYGYSKVDYYSAFLAILPPGVGCPPHVDSAPGMIHTHRVHLCVQTNDGVQFMVGNSLVPFSAGVMIEINNIGPVTHFVVNNGIQDRIHLIVDFYPTL